VGWFLASAGLAGVIAFELSNGLPLAPAVTAAPMIVTADGGAQAVPAFEPPASAAIDEIVTRPLFSKSREPFVPAAEAPVAAAAPAASFELIGTMVTGQSRIAMIQHAEKGVLWLREGQEIGGWRIAEIGGREVLLERDDETRDLRLRAEPLRPRANAEKATPAKREPAAADVSK
jgi:hypothetical protein